MMLTLIPMLAVATAFSFGDVAVDCKDPGSWTFAVTREAAEDGGEVAKIVLDAPAAAVPPRFTVRARVPQIDFTDKWSVNEGVCSMPPSWSSRGGSEVAIGMPLYVFFNNRDEAAFSIAVSECVRHVDVAAGILEEGSFLDMVVTFFANPEAPLAHYEASVRYNSRRRPFADAVRAEVAWIERAGGYTPCRTPEAALDPLYSSWYNFHQDVHDKDLEAECALAAKLGMKTLIVDDGWQTDDNARGYAYCGDWQVSKRRFPDMAAHVKRVQAMGIKYMMWYSVPFVGLKSANHAKFEGKYLVPGNFRNLGASVLDPRFPEVRKFLVDLYVQALKDWDIDGFKLDFIDSFYYVDTDPAVAEGYAGRDEKSVPVAVDRLMTEIKAALTAIKPDVLVEFRQCYVGPAIRKYGNMLRVGDCPGNMRRNRFAIANLRLASGASAVHADMLEWNFGEDAAQSALYVINSMFGVIQYSVMLRNAPAAHREMLAKWIKFSQDHRETLLKGRFTPHHPELQYPWIEAEGADERVVGVYSDGLVVDLPADGKKVFLMNASGRDRLTVRQGGAIRDVPVASGDWCEL